MRANLKIVNLNDVKPLMEHSEKQVEYFKRIIEESGSIRNPLFMARAGGGEFLLLEDTAILKALESMNLDFVPAQIVPLKKTLKIRAEANIEGMKKTYVGDFQRIFPRIIFASEKQGVKPDFSRVVELSILMKDQPKLYVYFKKSGANLVPPAFFHFFKFIGRYCRIGEKPYPAKVKVTNVKRSEEVSLLSVSNISANDLLFASSHRHLFPSRFLQFQYGCRIMGIDFPLAVLREKVCVREKERFLYDLVNLRVNSGYSTFIKSGVYILNY